MKVTDALAQLWNEMQLPAGALQRLTLTGADPVFPSSFAIGTAAQATMGCAALSATELAHLRGQVPRAVDIDMLAAAAECTGFFTIDGTSPPVWDAFSGLYRCADGFVRVHANFAHHRDGALQLLGLDPAQATREQAEQAMSSWSALAFEQAAADRGLVTTALRSFDEWDQTDAGRAIAAEPLLSITRIGDAPPRPLPELPAAARPLHGIRVLDLTRILAGPVAGRTLALLGADVMLINSPYLPNIPSIAETSRGKRSAHVDLATEAGRQRLWHLIEDAHVLSQGYRPGALAKLGFSPEAIAERRPGIVIVSLSAYGTTGPWAPRRGFDSLIQTAMGFNHAEGEAYGDGTPRPLPMQLLDQASGLLMAFGASVALGRQWQQGGSWHVQVSLARTGHWIRSLGRIADGLKLPAPDLKPFLTEQDSGFGRLGAIRPSIRLDGQALCYDRPSVPPGTDAARW